MSQRLSVLRHRDPLEGRAFLAAVLDLRDEEPSRAKALALYGDGLLAFMVGAHDDLRTREPSVPGSRSSRPGPGSAGHSPTSGSAARPSSTASTTKLARLQPRRAEFARTLEPAMGLGAAAHARPGHSACWAITIERAALLRRKHHPESTPRRPRDGAASSSTTSAMSRSTGKHRRRGALLHRV